MSENGDGVKLKKANHKTAVTPHANFNIPELDSDGPYRFVEKKQMTER